MKNKIITFTALLVLIAGIIFIPIAAYATEPPGETDSPDTAEITLESTESDLEETAAINVVPAVSDTNNADDMTAIRELFGASGSVSSESSIPQTSTPTDDIRPFTPDGQASVTDWAIEYDGKEFYTFTTASSNVFYLIIDNARTNDNVYFLNAVTESDLIALAETVGEPISIGDSAIHVATQTQTGEADEPSDSEQLTEEAKTPPIDNDGGNNSMIIFIAIVALALGSAGYYIKIIRPKQQTAISEDDYDEDELEDNEDIPFNDDTEEADDSDNSDGDDSDSDGSGADDDFDYADNVDIAENYNVKADEEYEL